jgi:hypothetical protein
MNQVQAFTEDLFSKYKEYSSTDEAMTAVKYLTEDQKKLVAHSLNLCFLNPKFKMKHFVTNGQMTPYSTIRQYLLELKAMEEATETFEYMLKKMELEKEGLIMRLEIEKDPIQRNLLQLELLRNEKEYKQNKRRLAQNYIEREQYLQLIEEFKAGPDAKTPDGKDWITEVFGNMEEENKWEEHYWVVRLAKQAAMDVVAYGRVGSGNMEAITQLPDGLREQSMALTHEVSLHLEALSNGLRQEVHEKLLESDPHYRALMSGKRPEDLNKIEFNIEQLTPVPSNDAHVASTINTPDQDLVNVYNNRNG